MKRSIKPARVVSNSSTWVTKIIFLQFLVLSSLMSEASTNKLPKQNNWFISGNTGIALRSSEVSGGFKFADDGFCHQPGFAFAFGFGKTLGNRWEPAIRWGAYTLFGQSSLPHYSSAGFYAAYPGFLQQEPLEYITQSNVFSFILRFLFSNGQQNGNLHAVIRPFIEAGLGINNYVTEVRYSKIPAAENASLIFRDRNGENANGAAQVTTGLGLKIGAKGEWHAEILMNAEWMNFSTLNAVSQMTNPVNNSSRAIVSRITAGLIIPIKATVKSDSYMPFRW